MRHIAFTSHMDGQTFRGQTFGGVMQAESDDCEDQESEFSRVYSAMQARGGFGGNTMTTILRF